MTVQHPFFKGKALRTRLTIQPLVMVNYACGFTQSETGKYLE